ncbi:SDR family oxidoreductase [Nonomuraea diastatica]|uniref:NmrA family transcriptional regulator n=1 Tax=Nonomuraea diastatica TaxID=1848329 RepID=A0A4V6PCZ8_9ACTN|nr:NAD(P)H-binding protein [Nonomuraea diastatica]TDD16806.1 NmrA family transcriptional regulator [Nonomuraea diastatica]
MTVLVTGARGNIGRHVVAELLARRIPGVRTLIRQGLTTEPARPLHPVRASSSPYPTSLPTAARQGRDATGITWPSGLVQVVEGDLTRPQTVAPALDGAELLFLFPVPETAAEIVELAAVAGVRRIVALSCGSAGHGDEHHLAVERALAASRLEWTCLRPYGLMSNALLWAPDVRANSVVRAPHGRFCYPHVHPADVAAVAVSALLERRHVGAIYTISGPEALTQIDQARLIGEAIGRPVRFQELNDRETHELWQSWGWSAEEIDLELYVQSEFVQVPAPLGAVVDHLLGQRPRTFAQWAAEHATAFR